MSLRKLLVLLFVTALLQPAVVLAGESRIELDDGSVLIGEVSGFDNGGYLIRTDTLGQVRIEEARIMSIRPCSPCDASGSGAARAAPVGAAAGASRQADLESMQKQLIADPQMMSSIMALQSDPKIRAALADPALLQGVLSGDLEALQQDPTFRSLLEHPAIQDLVEQYQR